MKDIHPTDPRYVEALDRFAEGCGFRAEKVLTPTSWFVAEVDGHAEVMLNREGMRVMAMFAPDPTAPQRVEEYLRHLDSQEKGN